MRSPRPLPDPAAILRIMCDFVDCLPLVIFFPATQSISLNPTIGRNNPESRNSITFSLAGLTPCSRFTARIMLLRDTGSGRDGVWRPRYRFGPARLLCQLWPHLAEFPGISARVGFPLACDPRSGPTHRRGDGETGRRGDGETCSLPHCTNPDRRTIDLSPSYQLCTYTARSSSCPSLLSVADWRLQSDVVLVLSLCCPCGVPDSRLQIVIRFATPANAT